MRNPFKSASPSPAPAAPEKKRTVQVLQSRSFGAAETDRLLAGWKWDNGFTAQDISGQLASIRSRSRDMQKNSAHYRKFLLQVATNLVGEGFSFKSMPQDGPPWERRLDPKAAAFIEYHFWNWCTHRNPDGKTYADLSGRKTMSEIDRMNAKGWARDGEYFMIPTVADNPYGFSLRVVRPDACDEKYNVARLANGNEVVCGIERIPSTGAPVAYYFRTTAENAFVTTPYGGHLTRIPAERVIHVFTPEDEGQPRGIPWAHAVLAKLKMLDEYDRAEITAARDEACTVRTYEADASADDDDFVDLTDPNNPDAVAVANSLMADKSPGQTEITPRGYKMKVTTPQHPNREVTAFKASMLRDVASGIGVEYANFANDWAGVSFSSVRLGTISERDFWMMLQGDMISQDKSRVFMLWLRSFLSLSISGDFPLDKYEKFSEHEYRGRRWMWVDPMRDMASAVIARDHGWKTDTQITADMGGDFGDNISEIKRETGDVKGTRLEGKTQTEPANKAERAARIIEAVAKTGSEKDEENED